MNTNDGSIYINKEFQFQFSQDTFLDQDDEV